MTRLVALATALALASTGARAQGLSGENLLTGVPDGFVSGDDAAQDGQEIHEFVPSGETVDEWSRMVTIEIYHGARGADVAGFAGSIAGGWEKACPGAVAGALEDGSVNGYVYVLWRFTCPLNPATGKPETMWMKAISGADSAYVVQYAYRAELSDAREQPALAYLADTSACDTRTPDHSCPAGM